MAVNLVTKIIEMLKMAGIDYSKMAGKIDPNKVKQLVTKTQKTATKPKLIDALNKEKATFSDALKIFEDEAQYISQMNEMELANFANNLDDYFKVGGKKKNIESNVVTTAGTPVEGKKLETLAKRKGAKGEVDTGSLKGSIQGLMSLVDEIEGISPKIRNQMDRDELAKFIQKMRGKKFTNEEVKLVREYMDEWGIGLAKERGAPAMEYAKKLGAKNKEEFRFIEEYLDNIQTTSPNEFREMFDVKKINMDISDVIEKKLEKHFKKKYKWDDTKRDGGLDDATFEKYEDEVYESSKQFSDFHRVYDTDSRPGIFGVRESTSWVNNPKNYLDEASETLQSITGEGLNVDFYKSYTDDVLNKYPKPEKFQYGGQVIKGPDMGATAHGSGELLARSRMFQPGGQTTTSTGLNYLLGEDDAQRIPFAGGGMDMGSVADSQGNVNENLGGNNGLDDRSNEIQNLNHRRAIMEARNQPSNFEKTITAIDTANTLNKGYNFLQGGGLKSLFALSPYAIVGATAAKIAERNRRKSLYEDSFKEEEFSSGGIARIGFSGGKLVDAGRRGFLKFVGGTAASIAALKSGLVKLLGGKNPEQVKKVIDEVVIAKETGAPEWFQPLINKILREGKEKPGLSYAERQVTRTMDTPNGQVDVIYKLDTGEVELSFVGDKTALGESVDLVYKPGEIIEEGKSAGKKTMDEFTASESVPEGIRTGVDDYSIELGFKETDNVGELASDLSELKTFATGEKQTMKEIVESIKKKKTRTKMETDQGIDYIIDTQGDVPYASGGLAKLLGE